MKKNRMSLPTVVNKIPKSTFRIDASKLKGNSFRVGKKVKVLVHGKITEESLDDYEVPGKKSFRLEVHKVTSAGGQRVRNPFRGKR